MNNNNLYNTNNFIGSTHQDYFKTASNAITSDIIATSNILENHIKLSSNNNIDFTNILRTDINKIIISYYDNELFSGAINTHIFANEILGEIRFITKNAPNYFGSTNHKFITKIKENGVLSVYYVYNPAYPTVLAGWYDVIDTIRDNYAFQSQTSGVLISIQQEINSLSAAATALEIIVEDHNIDILALTERVNFLSSLSSI